MSRREDRSSSCSSGYSASMAERVLAHITGTVWKVLVQVGDVVAADQELLILESMKMEINIEAPHSGTISRIIAKEGTLLKEGTVILHLQKS